MKYFIKTFGCQMNISDSERIAGFLESNGLKSAKKIDAADLVVLNTCGVRQMAEDRVYGLIHNLRTHNTKRKTIILTGCLASRPDVQKRMQDKIDLFFPINDFGIFENWIIRNSKLIRNLKLKIRNSFQNSCDYLSIASKYSDTKSAYVPIMTGCNNFCAYCVVPYARGREVSRPFEDIFSEIDKLAKDNYKEIVLLGQNVNSYISPSPACGRGTKGEGENKITFPALLKNLAKKYPTTTFRFLTSHPKDFSDELIDVIAKNKNIYREIHLPFQAGSNKILKAMNRPYTKKKYLDLIKKISKKVPDASFTTDVIVGFPGETKKYFEDSVDIFKKVVFNEAYINKYSPRPGTASWKLGDPIPLEEKREGKKFCENWSALILSIEKSIAMNNLKNKIIVILGPTSSGKSDVAIKLAQKFGGEIISADSRQIYRGMDIGSGKITKAEQKLAKHWMLDIISPKTNFSAAQFKKKAEKIIADILSRGKLPIICGGTGFWIKSIVDNITYPEVKPDWKLREKLKKKSALELFAMLKKLDSERAKTIDAKNKVRLIRAIEICKSIGKVPALLSSSPVYGRGARGEGENYKFLQIGTSWPKEKLYQRIKIRLDQRFKEGMIEEVRKLHFKDKVSWKRLESFGLGYFWISQFLQNKLPENQLFEKVYASEKDYAKRQMTWFSKDKRINWLRNYKEIEKETRNFLA